MADKKEAIEIASKHLRALREELNQISDFPHQIVLTGAWIHDRKDQGFTLYHYPSDDQEADSDWDETVSLLEETEPEDNKEEDSENMKRAS